MSYRSCCRCLSPMDSWMGKDGSGGDNEAESDRSADKSIDVKRDIINTMLSMMMLIS